MSSGVPKVSIGLPVYNGERYLALTIDSILAQSYTDFELIISDNCSNDRSEEICRRYAEQDSRIRFFPGKVNKGAAWNFQRVFKLARASYFRWAAADDVFASESVDACVKTLDAHPDAVLCYPKTVLIDGSGAVIKHYDDNLDLRSENPAERFRMAVRQIGLVNVLYGLMRRDVLRRIGPMGGYPGADIVLLFELALCGKFFEIDRPLFFRRMHGNASSSIETVEKLQAYIDPLISGEVILRRWRTLYEMILGVLRSEVSMVAKTDLLYFLLRDMLASREQYLKELGDRVTHYSKKIMAIC